MINSIIPYTPTVPPMEFIKSIVEGSSHSKIRSTFVIFLDIDGVVSNRPNQAGVFKKVAELFPEITGRYSNKVCSIAASHFFDKNAVQNLNFLIEKIVKTRNVWIVVSSNWRVNQSVEDLRNLFFGIHEFSKYIVDKTPEPNSIKGLGAYCPSISHSKEVSYSCRAAEIQYWLNQHSEITDYIVLDDNDDDLQEAFGERFVKTKYSTLLTKEICEDILLRIVE